MSSVAKNIFSLTVGQFFSLIFNFLSIVLAARFLGVEEFGIFTSSLAIVLIIAKFIDFGLSPIVFREQSKFFETRTLNTAITIKLIISIIIIVLSNIVFLFIGFSETEFIISNALFINIFISHRMANFREIISTPFKVILKMHYPMTLGVLENLIFLLMILLMPIFDLGINYFVFSYVFCSLPGFILLVYFLKKKTNYTYKIEISNWRWILGQSLPLAGFVLLMVIFQQIDIIILKYFKGLYETGIFSAATRLTMPLNIIPTTLVVTFFPSIVRNIKQNVSSKLLIKFLFKFLFWVSFILAVYVTGNPEKLVVTLFGSQYSDSAISTIFLFWAQVFLFFNFFALDLLTAYDKQFWNFIYAVLLVLFNFIFALILVPIYGFNGAAFAKLIASIISFLYLILILNRNQIKYNFVEMRTILWIVILVLSTVLISFFDFYIYSFFFGILTIVITILLRFFGNIEVDLAMKYFPKLEFIKKYVLK